MLGNPNTANMKYSTTETPQLKLLTDSREDIRLTNAEEEMNMTMETDL